MSICGFPRHENWLTRKRSKTQDGWTGEEWHHCWGRGKRTKKDKGNGFQVGCNIPQLDLTDEKRIRKETGCSGDADVEVYNGKNKDRMRNDGVM